MFMKNYYKVKFSFTQNDLRKQIQTTKFNNPIGLNFSLRFTHNFFTIVMISKQKIKTKIGFTCDLPSFVTY
jgi:hypothetical protein